MLQLSEVRLFGRLSDGVVLVLRSGKTSREEAKAARQRFLEDGTPVLGTILNDWNPQASDSRIYQKYAGYYQRKAGA